MKHKARWSLQLSTLAMAVLQAYAPLAMAQEKDSTVVVVTGIRGSAQSSVAIKRDSMEVVDSITAEDIGKLPDPNVAETLTRIPGVQGYRYGGEGAAPVGNGSGLTIRGMSGQTASQVNGRAFFSAGNREFNIESAIPGMIAGVDVYKNPSAEHVEGGIGGLVNVRTRNPSDFKGLTGAVSVGTRYNDLAKKAEPEVFGLVANRWNLAGGGRIGVMLAGQIQESTNRSDNNPGNRGIPFKRIIRADSPEYATLAAANTSNAPGQAQSQFIGRSDVSLLANVGTRPIAGNVGPNTADTTGLTPEQVKNIIAAPAVNNNVFQETIMRTRKGMNMAADWRVDNTLRFYVDGNYTSYLFNQHYRGLNSSDGANVRNLQTTPFIFDKQLSNRNLTGGANDVLSNTRLLSGDFLNSTMSTIGGDEHTQYITWNAAVGAEWNPTPNLALKADSAYLQAKRSTDNRAVNLDSKAGVFWTTQRVADGAPHFLDFQGPSLADASNFVFRDYNNGNNSKFEDGNAALALSGTYTFDAGFFTRLKFGTRLARQDSTFNAWNFGRLLTTDGLALNAARSNGVLASTYPVTSGAPTNFMRGDTGYSGGYLVYTPGALLGDQVKTQFPNAGILSENALPENPLARRYIEEKTKAMYLVGEFSAFDERLRGAAGVRVVRTQGLAISRVTDTTTGTSVVRELARNTSYTNTLPSFNATYDISKEFLARFGYGRGLTRAPLGDLNPFVNINVADGTGSVGNPNLKPLIADSLDLSFEHYFSKTNYAALGLFNKDIKGFFNDVGECVTVDNAPAYTGTIINGCTNGQYRVSRKLNAEDGYADGVELSGQYFFDKQNGWLKNFGTSGSYTFVKTSNPVNFGTVAAPRIIETMQPFQSRHSASISGLYEDEKLSGRLVYTWRSQAIFLGADAQPIWGRYMKAYGILDGSINYNFSKQLTLSFNASNILDNAPHRYIGEPHTFETGIELQHYGNGRSFGMNLRYRFGN